jgi:hypothetical protein
LVAELPISTLTVAEIMASTSRQERREPLESFHKISALTAKKQLPLWKNWAETVENPVNMGKSRRIRPKPQHESPGTGIGTSW